MAKKETVQKKEIYNLESLKSYKSSFDMNKGVVIIIVIAFSAALVGMFVLFSSKLNETNQRIWILDRNNGFVYPAAVGETTEYDKNIEYHTHVKSLVHLWYEFDENNFDSNIAQAMYLLGDCGKAMVDVYNEYKVKDQLLQKNLRYIAEIQDIQFNWQTSPVEGYVIVKQIVTKGLNKESRNFKATFYILDEGINRSLENPHGLKIENWKVENIVAPN